MGLFKKLKDYARKVNEIEYNISNNKKEFIEIYERNLALEREIVQRTQELDQANKAFLTLKNVWEVMNSAKPLANVLQKLVNSLYKEMGYINSTILQFSNDDNDKYYIIKAFSECPIFDKLSEFLKQRQISVYDYHLKYDSNMFVSKSVEENTILYSSKYSFATYTRERLVMDGRILEDFGVTTLPSLVTNRKLAPPVSSTFVLVAESRYIFSSYPSS